VKITVKMSGLIAKLLPGSTDGIEVDLEDGTTVTGLMDQLNLPSDGTYLVIANDTTVPKGKRPEHKLSDGDRVAIVPPLKGG